MFTVTGLKWFVCVWALCECLTCVHVSYMCVCSSSRVMDVCVCLTSVCFVRA